MTGQPAQVPASQNDSTHHLDELFGARGKWDELARLLAYEATADFPLEVATIQCWSGPTEVQRISGRKVTVVPILRAGVGMLDGVLDMIPNAKVSVVGLSRNHETLQPVEYYCKLPDHLDERLSIVVDPMLATGNSSVAAIDLLKAQGATNIRFLCLLAAPEGIARMKEAHPDVPIVTASVDSHLNDHGYI